MQRKIDIRLMAKQMLDTLIKVLIVISATGLILLVPLYVMSFSEGFYLDGFDRYSIYEDTGLGKDKIDKEFKYLLDYVEGREDSLPGNFFNEKEKEHFKDVRDIFKFIRMKIGIYLMLLLASVSYLVHKKARGKAILSIRLGAMVSAGVIMLLSILSLADFRWTFTQMHRIVFVNNLWLMDYNTDVIIRLMPQGMFFDLALISFGISLVISLILIFLPQLRDIYNKLILKTNS